MKKLSLDTPRQKLIQFEVEKKKQKADPTWFRGDHCNFNPQLVNMVKEDSVLKHVINGWMPEKPLISPETQVVAFGSCFAENITKWLSARNYSVLTEKGGDASDAYVVRFGEGMVNTFVIRQQFEWAFEDKKVEEQLWHGYDAQSFGYNENVRQVTRKLFMESDVFIITLGLSEVWYDEVTGGVFWRAVPHDQYDPERHKFRVSSVSENKENIAEIYKLIKKYRPDAKVIFTLSPIPLVATFRPVSCMSANSVSKAILRSALDEVIREINEPESLFYWPSYEIVLDVFSNRWKADRRHVKEPILDFIMTLFETVWCNGSEPSMSLAEAWLRALAATEALPPKLSEALDTDNARLMADIHTFFTRRKEPQKAQLVLDAVETFVKNKPGSNLAKWFSAVPKQA